MKEKTGEKRIAVCSKCFCASCLKGFVRCKRWRSATPKYMTRAELRFLDLEHWTFWGLGR